MLKKVKIRKTTKNSHICDVTESDVMILSFSISVPDCAKLAKPRTACCLMRSCDDFASASKVEMTPARANLANAFSNTC